MRRITKTVGVSTALLLAGCGANTSSEAIPKPTSQVNARVQQVESEFTPSHQCDTERDAYCQFGSVALYIPTHNLLWPMDITATPARTSGPGSSDTVEFRTGAGLISKDNPNFQSFKNAGVLACSVTSSSHGSNPVVIRALKGQATRTVASAGEAQLLSSAQEKLPEIPASSIDMQFTIFHGTGPSGSDEMVAIGTDFVARAAKGASNQQIQAFGAATVTMLGVLDSSCK